MTRKVELLALLAADTIAVSVASYLYYMARFEWTWFEAPLVFPELTPVMLGLSFYWLVVFFFSGMYRERYAASRFDELISILKVVAAGILVLIFAIYIDTLNTGTTRSEIFFYGATVYLSVGMSRVIVRSIQKALILRGVGTHKALIVGWGDRVDKLHEDIGRYPAAGLDVVGMIRLRQPSPAQQPVIVGGYEQPALGGDGANLDIDVSISDGIAHIDEIPELINKLQVQDVLITLGPNHNDELMEILRVCDGTSVSLKLVPDFYSVIGGMARTEHLYGLPLIEVLPAPMPAWEESTKRLIDFIASLVILILGMPVWFFIASVIKMTSKGPAIYKQRRVGYKGKVFTMLKFRTMVENAEAKTGPVWASENDPRYTPIGRWLRKTRLDEIPQLWNVLKGDMSLVGPRPERPYFVEKLAKEIPLYSRRYRVKPGITGWAQVTWHYDASLDDVRQKVKYDLFYIANLSLRMDLKILFLTIRTALLGKGR